MDPTPNIQPMQCRATSKQSGEQCKRSAIKGGLVCNIHGGKAPQVKASAEARIEEAKNKLLEMIEPAIPIYRELLTGALSEQVKVQMLKDLFDRVGMGATHKQDQRVVIEHSPGGVEEEIRALMEEIGETGS